MPTVDKIPVLEVKFVVNLRVAGGIYFNKVPVVFPSAIGLRPKKGNNGFQYESYYFEKEYPKKKIIMHSTVGFFTGDLSMLAKEDVHMSVNYVIARNGTVYEMFDPKNWSYHLGSGAVGGNGYGSKENISIELSNIGPLTLDGSIFRNVYGSKYCDVTDVTAFTEYVEGFRGYRYFVTFTDEQYTSLQSLLTFLTSTYNIPYIFLPESKRVNAFISSTEARVYSGICSHVNFRATGKYDIGPDFYWERITSDVEPIIPDKETEFVFEDDKPVTNIYNSNFGKVTQTATEKAKESNNSNSSHFCSLSNVDNQDETYEGGTMGNMIIDKFDTIEWENIDSTDMEAMRKAATDMIAEGFYEYITSADTLGEPLHFTVDGTLAGTYVVPPATTAIVIPPTTKIKFDKITWPTLNDLQNTMNKYYTGIPDLFKAIFEDWLGTIAVTPISDDPAILFLPGVVPGLWLTGDFQFKWDSALVLAQATACEAALAANPPTKLIETWMIIQDWLFKTLTLALVGEQAGIGAFITGPSTGAATGGGASVGYCLGVTQNVYTCINTTCLLTFTNPDV